MSQVSEKLLLPTKYFLLVFNFKIFLRIPQNFSIQVNFKNFTCIQFKNFTCIQFLNVLRSFLLMPRRYRYKRYFGNKDKYSHETTNIQTPYMSSWTLVPSSDASIAPSRQFTIPIIPPTDVQGMRKVKHITASFTCDNKTYNNVVYYYIVYVPQGYQSQPVSVPAIGNAVNGYSANQFIMGSGVLDFEGGPCRIRSPLSRNLNSGDSIVLILELLNEHHFHLQWQV